jgi:hypothetical protein
MFFDHLDERNAMVRFVTHFDNFIKWTFWLSTGRSRSLSAPARTRSQRDHLPLFRYRRDLNPSTVIKHATRDHQINYECPANNNREALVQYHAAWWCCGRREALEERRRATPPGAWAQSTPRRRGGGTPSCRRRGSGTPCQVGPATAARGPASAGGARTGPAPATHPTGPQLPGPRARRASSMAALRVMHEE